MALPATLELIVNIFDAYPTGIDGQDGTFGRSRLSLSARATSAQVGTKLDLDSLMYLSSSRQAFNTLGLLIYVEFPKEEFR